MPGYPAQGYDSLEWVFQPAVLPSGLPNPILHYYAMEFWLLNSSSTLGFGYAGFQSNGQFEGAAQGQVVNFSIWGSTDGHSSGTPGVNLNNTEAGGVQIMVQYAFQVGHEYQFELRAGPSGSTSVANWWGLYVIDLTAAMQPSTFIGEILVPNSNSGQPMNQWQGATLMFGEDTHWWTADPGTVVYQCSDFAPSSMACQSVTANGGEVAPSSWNFYTNSGQTSSDNGYITTTCEVSEYQLGSRVQHNLGYQATLPPNVLQPWEMQFALAIVARGDVSFSTSSHPYVTPDGSGLFVSSLTALLYSRLPDVYRDDDRNIGDKVTYATVNTGTGTPGSFDVSPGLFDAAGRTFDEGTGSGPVTELVEVSRIPGRPLLRYISCLVDQLASVDAFVAANSSPTASSLTDPATADVTWLPWLGQLVGVTLPQPVDAVQGRYLIANALSGVRKGSKQAIANLVAATLTGTKTVTVTNGYGGNPWYIGVNTLASETPPDPAPVVLTVTGQVFTWGVSMWGSPDTYQTAAQIELMVNNSPQKPAGFQIVHTRS